MEKEPDFQWVGSQWLNSGAGAWFTLNKCASVGSAKQPFAYSTSVNPHPSVCSWTAASRHFPPEKTLPSNTCEPQCQIPWQVLMAFTKALRILISWVAVAHSIHHLLSFSKLLSRNAVLKQNPTATSPLAPSPKIQHPLPSSKVVVSSLPVDEACSSYIIWISPQECFSFQRKIWTYLWWSRPLQTRVTLEMSVTPAHCRKWRLSLLLSLVHQVSKMMWAEIPLGILCREDKSGRAGAQDYNKEIWYSCALIPVPSYIKVAELSLSLLKTESTPFLSPIMKNHQRTFTLEVSNCCLRAWIGWPLKVSFNPNCSIIPANSLIYED